MGKLLVWTLWGHPCMWRHIFSILVCQGTMLYLLNGLGWFTLNFYHCFDWKLSAFACSCLKQFGQFLCHIPYFHWCNPILSSFSLFGSSANKINTKQCCWNSIFFWSIARSYSCFNYSLKWTFLYKSLHGLVWKRSYTLPLL